MEYTRYNEQSEQFIQKAIAFRDAVSQCSVDYQERAKTKNGLNLEIKDKLSEVSRTGIWAFKGYYNTFSLSKYVTEYFSDTHEVPSDDGDRDVNLERMNEATITAYCAPIDLPIACLAGAVGAGAKLTQNMVKMAGESVVYYFQKSANPDQFQRKSHLGLLQLHVYRIQCVLDQKPIKLLELAQLCHHILMDLSKIVSCSSLSSVSVGEHYLADPFIYDGLRHYVTGNSRLADIIERNVIWQYDFEADVAYFNSPRVLTDVRMPEIYLDINGAQNREKALRSNYPAFQFSKADNKVKVPTHSVENINNDINYTTSHEF